MLQNARVTAFTVKLAKPHSGPLLQTLGLKLLGLQLLGLQPGLRLLGLNFKGLAQEDKIVTSFIIRLFPAKSNDKIS